MYTMFARKDPIKFPPGKLTSRKNSKTLKRTNSSITMF